MAISPFFWRISKKQHINSAHRKRKDMINLTFLFYLILDLFRIESGSHLQSGVCSQLNFFVLVIKMDEYCLRHIFENCRTLFQLINKRKIISKKEIFCNELVSSINLLLSVFCSFIPQKFQICLLQVQRRLS